MAQRMGSGVRQKASLLRRPRGHVSYPVANICAITAGIKKWPSPSMLKIACGSGAARASALGLLGSDRGNFSVQLPGTYKKNNAPTAHARVAPRARRRAVGIRRRRAAAETSRKKNDPHSRPRRCGRCSSLLCCVRVARLVRPDFFFKFGKFGKFGKFDKFDWFNKLGMFGKF